MTVHMLAFGAHADDVEIGMAGTIAKYTKTGLRVGICDLTKAELSSNGTVELREQEAEHARKQMGASIRLNVELPDRGLYMKEDYITKIVEVIRKQKPNIVCIPYQEDRHPDHGACARLVEEAVFSAAIRNYMPQQEAHRVQAVYYYMINGFHKPSFCIDISEEIHTKRLVLESYASQFTKGAGAVSTPLTDGYIETVIARDKLFGKEVGVSYAEGFISKIPLLLNKDLLGGV